MSEFPGRMPPERDVVPGQDDIDYVEENFSNYAECDAFTESHRMIRGNNASVVFPIALAGIALNPITIGAPGLGATYKLSMLAEQNLRQNAACDVVFGHDD
jgi:hypothetical protein